MELAVLGSEIFGRSEKAGSELEDPRALVSRGSWKAIVTCTEARPSRPSFICLAVWPVWGQIYLS